MTLKTLLWATKSWSQITESASVYKIDVNLAISNEDDGTSKIKINIAGRLYLFVPIIISFVLKQLNKKWKIKNGQRAISRFFNSIYVIRKRIVCTSLETRCISEPFEVQMKIGEVQTGTNDSLSNDIN